MYQQSSSARAYLQFMSGPLALQILPLSQLQTWIGSDPNCTIHLPLPSIRPFHACLMWNDDGNLFISNYDQSMVKLNEQKVSSTIPIGNGDMVALDDDITLSILYPQDTSAQSLLPDNEVKTTLRQYENYVGNSNSGIRRRGGGTSLREYENYSPGGSIPRSSGRTSLRQYENYVSNSGRIQNSSGGTSLRQYENRSDVGVQEYTSNPGSDAAISYSAISGVGTQQYEAISNVQSLPKDTPPRVQPLRTRELPADYLTHATREQSVYEQPQQIQRERTDNDVQARIASSETQQLWMNAVEHKPTNAKRPGDQERYRPRRAQRARKSFIETTRYLCAAAQFDETFRQYVFRNIVEERHRTLGEAFGVDIISVVKWCFAAQKRTFLRDIILASILFIQIVLLYPAWLYVKDRPYFVIYLMACLVFFAIPFIMAWFTVAIERVITYYGSAVRRLAKGRFVANEQHMPLPASTERMLAEQFNASDGSMIVYSGLEPFAGAGINIGRWSFVVDVTRGKQVTGTMLTPVKFYISDIYEFVCDRIDELVIDGDCELSLENKLYANGQEVRREKAILPDPRSRPLTRADDGLLHKYKEQPCENIRYYKCIRVTSWGGEVVLSIYLRLVQSEKNLFIEGNYFLLPPLKEAYHQIDTLEPELTLAEFWRIARVTFVPTFQLLLRSSGKVWAWLFREQAQHKREGRTLSAIKENPGFDYGATTSLRYLASTRDYRHFFQKLDAEMYVKIIENELLGGIITFLDTKNIATSEIKQYQEMIVNNGVIAQESALAHSVSVVSGNRCS